MQSLAVGRGLPQLRQPKALSFCRVTGRSPLGVRCSSISVHASGDPEAPRSVRQNEKLLKQLAAAGATVACGLCVAKLFISSHQPALANDAVRSAPSASITYSTPPPAPGPGQWLSYKLMQVCARHVHACTARIRPYVVWHHVVHCSCLRGPDQRNLQQSTNACPACMLHATMRFALALHRSATVAEPCLSAQQQRTHMGSSTNCDRCGIMHHAHAGVHTASLWQAAGNGRSGRTPCIAGCHCVQAYNRL